MSTLPTPIRKLLPQPGRPDAVGELVSAFESETAALVVRTTPRRENLVLYLLVAMLVITVTLAAVVKLDIVVTGTGYVEPAGGAVYISPLNAGIVREVKVRAGEVVKKGQVLATLDPTFTAADVTQLKLRYASDRAQVERDRAEQADKPYEPSADEPADRVQMGIWQQRQGEYHFNVANYDAQIRSSAATVNQYQHDVDEYEKRLKLAADVENMYHPLLDSGYVSKLQWMASVDTRVEIGRLLSDARNQLDAQKQTLQSLQAQRDAYVKKWHSDVGADLVATGNDLDLTRDSLDKALHAHDLITLSAPQDAVVLKVGKISPGSLAIAPNDPSLDPLITLMPITDDLLVEVDVQTLDVGFIKKGDPVVIKLDAYNYLEHGVVNGVVESISEGSFTTDINNQPVPAYVKAMVKVTKVGLREVRTGFRLIPGMTLSGDIHTGRRTILMYLLRGAMRTSDEAMREPE